MSALMRLIILMMLAAVANAGDWVMNPDESSLTFTASYDGGGFSGRFESFEVALDFDLAMPEQATLEVIVDVTTVDTENSDRDSTLANEDWFHFDDHPKAIYRVTGFEKLAEQKYMAEGKLTLKGVSKTVPLSFTFKPDGEVIRVSGRAIMAGNANINRLDFNIGSGDWEDPDLIGHEVFVEFELLLISQ